MQALLDLSRRNERMKSAFVQADTQALEQKKASLGQAQAALSGAESKRASDEEKKQLAAAVAQAKLEVAAAAENLKSAQDLADEAARTRQAIEKSFEIAQAEEKSKAPATNTAPSAQAAAVDQAPLAQVAIAVKDIVTAVVNRDYTAQGCFALLTTDSSTAMSPEQAASRAELVKFCMGAVQSAQAR